MEHGSGNRYPLERAQLAIPVTVLPVRNERLLIPRFLTSRLRKWFSITSLPYGLPSSPPSSSFFAPSGRTVVVSGSEFQWDIWLCFIFFITRVERDRVFVQAASVPTGCRSLYSPLLVLACADTTDRNYTILLHAQRCPIKSS